MLLFLNSGLAFFTTAINQATSKQGFFFLPFFVFLFNACYISAMYFLSTEKYPFKAWYYWAAFNHAQQSHVFSAFVWPLFLGMKYQWLNSVTSFHSFIPILVLFLSHWVKLTYCKTSPISITSGINLFHCVEAVNTILAGSRLEKARWRPPSQAVCLTAVLIFIFVQQWGFFLPFVPLCPSFHNLPLPFSIALIRTGWSFWLPLRLAKRCLPKLLPGLVREVGAGRKVRPDTTQMWPLQLWHLISSRIILKGRCMFSHTQRGLWVPGSAVPAIGWPPSVDWGLRGKTEIFHVADGHAECTFVT